MAVFEKRLEIRIDSATFTLLHEESKRLHKSIGALVRLAVENRYAQKNKKERILASENLCNLNAPAADWKQMEKEIEQGYE